jgi:hypothetical protein
MALVALPPPMRRLRRSPLPPYGLVGGMSGAIGRKTFRRTVFCQKRMRAVGCSVWLGHFREREAKSLGPVRPRNGYIDAVTFKSLWQPSFSRGLFSQNV